KIDPQFPVARPVVNWKVVGAVVPQSQALQDGSSAAETLSTKSSTLASMVAASLLVPQPPFASALLKLVLRLLWHFATLAESSPPPVTALAASPRRHEAFLPAALIFDD